jgi:osmoprotectant transport system ATP-binding protein
LTALALSASAVSKRFGAVVALDDATLGVGAGECVALVGESGSGKSTLLRAFNALTGIDGGRVEVGGEDVAHRDPVTLRRSLGYVPQDGGLLPHWPVPRNVALVPWLLGRADPARDAATAMGQVGLDPAQFAARWPHELSGGQRQRVAFARALAAGARTLLLDEPFGALDAITRGDLQAMFLDLRRASGLSALLVTHDLHEAGLVADRVAVMHQGRIAQIGPLAELVARPATPYVAELLTRARLRPEPAAHAQTPPATPPAGRPIVVGSKPFGESYLPAELFAQILEARGFAVARRFGLGGSEIVFPALRDGAIDVVPEYTGSGLLVILKAPLERDPIAVFDTVSCEFARQFDIRWLPPLGFENTYAMSIRTEWPNGSGCGRSVTSPR